MLGYIILLMRSSLEMRLSCDTGLVAEDLLQARLIDLEAGLLCLPSHDISQRL